jgi:hypothetical protein
LDIMFGDLSRWITPVELNDFDIVTYGFGDQDRLYLRGQFTFHKNNDRINQLWRPCEYLSHMDQRFASVMSGEEKMHFESAEGCYSMAILQQKDIKVKYAVKAFTDVKEQDTTYSHGIYVGIGKNRDRSVVYKAGSKEGGKELEKLSDTWFEMKDVAYNNLKKQLQWEIGTREPVPLDWNEQSSCMYWAQQKYQSLLCNDNFEATDTAFWIDGQLYKQKYETAKFPSNVVTAPFFHFQEWKRYYRWSQLVTFHRHGNARTFVLGKEGAIPIYTHEYKRDKKSAPSHLGINTSRWNGVKGGNREQLPGHSYCLRSGPRRFPPSPPAPQCRIFSSWHDQETVEIISSAPGWNQVDADVEVTMALTLQISAEQAADPAVVKGLLGLVKLYLDRWQGQPSVLVVHVAGATPEIMAMLRVRLGPGSNLSYGLETCLVAVIFSKEPDFFSRKALLNMALDAAPTRWVVSGFELERGVVVSHDTAFFAHRVSRTHEDLPGHVFIIPQFGLVDEESSFTVPSLWKAKEDGSVSSLPEFEEEKCNEADGAEDKGGVFGLVVALWWQLTETYVTGKVTTMDDNLLTTRATDDIQLSLINLLTEGKHYNLFAMDVSPIILTDHLGPRNGMLTSELAREVEEFGGKQCYNGLRLSQLATLGYTVDILAGAFAASTAGTRKAAVAGISTSSGVLGESRCDGCFLFDEEHEDILEEISKDERQRPAKAAILWDHKLNGDPLQGHT